MHEGIKDDLNNQLLSIRSKVRLPVVSGQQLMESSWLFKSFFTPDITTNHYSFVPLSPLVSTTVTASIDQQTGRLHGPATMEGTYLSEILYNGFGHPLPEDQQYASEPFRIEVNFDQGVLSGNYTEYLYDGNSVSDTTTLFSVHQLYLVDGKLSFFLSISIEEMILNLGGGGVNLWLQLGSANYTDVREFFVAQPLLSFYNQPPAGDYSRESLEIVWKTKILVASHLADRVSIK